MFYAVGLKQEDRIGLCVNPCMISTPSNGVIDNIYRKYNSVLDSYQTTPLDQCKVSWCAPLCWIVSPDHDIRTTFQSDCLICQCSVLYRVRQQGICVRHGTYFLNYYNLTASEFLRFCHTQKIRYVVYISLRESQKKCVKKFTVSC